MSKIKIKAKMHKCGAYPFAKYFLLYGSDPSAREVFSDLSGANGLTAMLGGRVACVYVAAELGHAETLATLVHESVHVWQMIQEAAGEHGHGVEAEAYGIQQIFAHLRADLVKIVEAEEKE
jgi:hypothetical protein